MEENLRTCEKNIFEGYINEFHGSQCSYNKNSLLLGVPLFIGPWLHRNIEKKRKDDINKKYIFSCFSVFLYIVFYYKKIKTFKFFIFLI